MKATAKTRWLAKNPLRRYLAEKQRYGSIVELARRIGCRRQSIYAWMAGQWVPTLTFLVKIQLVTGITPDEWSKWLAQEPTKGRTCSQH